MTAPPARAAPLRVVAALIADAEGRRVLVQQRRAGGAQPLAWELPGGKVEPGESDAAALRRECREELGATIAVGERVYAAEHAYAARTVALVVYRGHWPRGAPPPACHAAAQQRWADVAELARLRFCAADVPLVAQLVRGVLPLCRAQSGSASTRRASPR